MDVREKLVELLDIIIQPGQKTLGYIADYLISNGVTVQEWISVKDRLPEDDSDVLAYSRNGEEGRIYPANYTKGVWFDCIFTTPATDTTTHWMPLAEPPKGE
ncbi:MAG: DUF551 domain-containing protein [Eubacteriales bacterium]|nr:DUF551 domain-containing protein [Eubacteriales bacterium]